MTGLHSIFIIALFAATAWSQSDQVDPERPMERELALDRMLKARESSSSDPDLSERLLEEVTRRAPDEQTLWESLYTRGVIALREGRHAHATEMLTRAVDSATTDPQRRDSWFNVAHAHAAVSLSSDMILDPSERLTERIKHLGRAEGAFLASATVDPEHTASIRNLERVRIMLNQLREQQEQQKEQQEQNEGDQQENEQSDMDNESSPASEQLQQLADDQRDESQQNESPDQEQQDSASSDQEQLSEQTQQAQDQLSEQANQNVLDSLQEAQQAQQEAQEALESGDFESAAQAQQRAADAIERAADQMAAQEQSESQTDQGQPNPQEPDQQPSDEQPEIDELAEALLDQEQQQRERRDRYRSRGRPVRVEEDW